MRLEEPCALPWLSREAAGNAPASCMSSQHRQLLLLLLEPAASAAA